MPEVLNLAQITRKQVVLADRMEIGVRLGASGIVLLLCLAAGQATLSVIAASVFFGLAIFSLVAGVLLTRKRDPSPLFIPSLSLDCAAVAASGVSAFRFLGFVPSLPILIVLEAYCAAIALLSALRLSTRDVMWAGGASVLAPAIVSLAAFILLPDPGVKALLLIPVLNALIASFTGVIAGNNQAALKDNLRRRKAQARERAAEAGQPGQDPDPAKRLTDERLTDERPVNKRFTNKPPFGESS